MSARAQQDSFLDRQKQKETERQAIDAYQLGEKFLNDALVFAYQHGLLGTKIDTHPQISSRNTQQSLDPEQQLTSLYSAAIQHFSDAIQLQMTKIQFYFARAKTYFLCQEFHRYVFDLSIALHVDDQNYALYTARAHGFYKLQKYQEAIMDLDFAVQKALLLQDELRGQKKRMATMSDRQIRNLTAVPPISNAVLADLYYRRGVCKAAIKQYSEAIGDFTNCIQLHETHPNAYARRGAAYMKGSKKDGLLGVQDLKRSTQLLSADTPVHLRYYKLGQAYLHVSQNQNAVDAFSQAIDSAANYINERRSQRHRRNQTVDPHALYRQVVLNWYDNQRFRIMEFDAPETSDLDEQNDFLGNKQSFPEFYAARGKAKALLGHHQDALADFSISIQQDDNNAQTLYERSQAQRIMANYSDSLQDIELCARRRLNADIAYSKAIILENQGRIDQSLELYESILVGVFSRQFGLQFLQEFSDQVSVIDQVLRQSKLQEEFQTSEIRTPHLSSLFHAALLHRVKLNFPRAILLLTRAIQIDPDDERFYDLLAMIYHDTLAYDDALQMAEKSISIQEGKPTGVNWETYYIKAACQMQKKNYNQALGDLIQAQQRPAGGFKEKQLLLKKPEADKVIYWLAWLPPGSPLATAYHITNNIESIPKDPISPTSAARIDNGQMVFPLLDVQGAFPGFYNHFINMKKAECLFFLEDYVGCVRCISKTLDDFNYEKFTKRGVRQITNAMKLVRDGKQIKTPPEYYNKGNETDWLTQNIEVDLSGDDRDLLYNLYFLRARALFQLNKFQHALKDCGKAYFVVVSSQKFHEKVPAGVGNVLFFMSKIYAYLRLYVKSYHCARDSVISGIPYFAVYRAYYMQGVALVYIGRLQLAQKCFQLALRAHFTARMAKRINERIDKTGVIQLPTLEEISIYLQANMQDIEDLHLDVPRLQAKQQLFEVKEIKIKPFSDLNKTKHIPLEQDSMQPRLEQIRAQLTESDIMKLKFDVRPFNEYIMMQNKDVQQQSQLPNQLLQLISLPRVWLCRENAFVLHERAKTLQLMGLNEIACDDFTSLIRLDPNNPRLYFRRAFSLKKLSLFDYAAIDLMTAQRLDPDNLKFQVDFEKLNDDYIEVEPAGNEEYYIPPATSIKGGEKPRIYKYYYDVYEGFDEMLSKHEWTFYQLRDIQDLYDEVDQHYKADEKNNEEEKTELENDEEIENEIQAI